MRRKLSTAEYLIECNLAAVVTLEGSLSLVPLRSALARVQRKHPALRALIRKEADGLYYEEASAPKIPLRVALRVADDDYHCEIQSELTCASHLRRDEYADYNARPYP